MKDKLLCIDLMTLPQGWDINQFVTTIEEHGYLFYDSHNGGRKPYYLNKKDIFGKVLVDITTEEGKQIVQQIKNKE